MPELAPQAQVPANAGVVRIGPADGGGPVDPAPFAIPRRAAPCITSAAEDRGARPYLPLLLSPRIPLYPQGVRRIRKAAELPTAAQLLGAAPGGCRRLRRGGFNIRPPPGSQPTPGERQRKAKLVDSFTAPSFCRSCYAGAQSCAEPPPAQGRRGRRSPLHRFARPSSFGKSAPNGAFCRPAVFFCRKQKKMGADLLRGARGPLRPAGEGRRPKASC